MKRIIIISALVLLAGCSSLVPMEQLEAEAIRTGDWSLVEQRERIIARRNLRSNLNCPPRTTGYCEIGPAGEKCVCVESDIIRASLDDWDD